MTHRNRYTIKLGEDTFGNVGNQIYDNFARVFVDNDLRPLTHPYQRKLLLSNMNDVETPHLKRVYGPIIDYANHEFKMSERELKRFIAKEPTDDTKSKSITYSKQARR